jgi:GT2 family glycosyltransferase
MVDIVIVNWNSGELLSSCIKSIEENNIQELNSIIVVDNNSSDGSEKITSKSKNFILVKNQKNLGFGRSCNIGSEYCNSDFILFLNPDTVLFPNTLQKTKKYMKKNENEEVGIAGIQLLDAAGNIHRHSSVFPSVFRFFLRSTGIHKIFLSLDHVLSNWNHDDTKEVPHVIGAFFFVRSELFKKLNGFDERFFVYLEDLDFSLRASKLGWKTHFISSIQSMHIAGGTSRQIKAKRLFYSLRSRIIYSYKHFSFFGATSILLSVILIEPLSRIAFSAKELSIKSFKNLLRTYILLFEWLACWIKNYFREFFSKEI